MTAIVLPVGMTALYGELWPEGVEQFGQDVPELGLCCACEQRLARVLVRVDRRGLWGRQGWGCLDCGLPPDGLQVVLCLDCFTGERPVLYGCVGWPSRGDRAPIGAHGEPWLHRAAGHPELAENTEGGGR